MISPLGEAQQSVVHAQGMALLSGQPLLPDQIRDLNVRLVDQAMQVMGWQAEHKGIIPDELLSTSTAIRMIGSEEGLDDTIIDALTRHPDSTIRYALARYQVITDEQLERLIDGGVDEADGLRATQIIRRWVANRPYSDRKS